MNICRRSIPQSLRVVRCLYVQVLRGLHVRYASIFDQARRLKLELPRKLPSLHGTPSSSIKTPNSVSSEPVQATDHHEQQDLQSVQPPVRASFFCSRSKCQCRIFLGDAKVELGRAGCSLVLVVFPSGALMASTFATPRGAALVSASMHYKLYKDLSLLAKRSQKLFCFQVLQHATVRRQCGARRGEREDVPSVPGAGVCAFSEMRRATGLSASGCLPASRWAASATSSTSSLAPGNARSGQVRPVQGTVRAQERRKGPLG